MMICLSAPIDLKYCSNCLLSCTVQHKPSEKEKWWIFYCGATDTMTHDKGDFVNFCGTMNSQIQTTDGELTSVEGSGTIEISPTLKLSNCLYVPKLSHKLMSISHMTKELNCTLLMHPNFGVLQYIKMRRIIGRGTERQGLYYVGEMAHQGSATMLAHGSATREAWLWHRRFSHPSHGYFKLLFPNFSHLKNIDCESCVSAKSHGQSFKSTEIRVKSLFSLVHADVWGPAPITGDHGFKYFLLFVDDCSRMTWVIF